MSEEKKRKYGHVQAMESEIEEKVKEGKTQREIAEHFGYQDKYVVKEFLKRQRRKERNMQAGIPPRRRGRLPKGYQPTEQEKDNEIKRLKMENELLRDFLHLAGKK